jgi:hypothetical protein
MPFPLVRNIFFRLKIKLSLTPSSRETEETDCPLRTFLTVLRLKASSYFLFISLILSKESFCSTFIRPSQYPNKLKSQQNRKREIFQFSLFLFLFFRKLSQVDNLHCQTLLPIVQLYYLLSNFITYCPTLLPIVQH